jgi:hypothetical protein
MFRRFPPDILALAATPLFLNLTDRELDAVQRAGTVVDVPAGRTMPCPGRHPAQFAVVIWGQVAATSRDGRRRVLRAGDWFGTGAEEGTAAVPDRLSYRHPSGQAYPEPAPRETFETVVPTTLFVMNRRDLAVLGARCPCLAARFRGLLTRAREVSVNVATSMTVAALTG